MRGYVADIRGSRCEIAEYAADRRQLLGSAAVAIEAIQSRFSSRSGMSRSSTHRGERHETISEPGCIGSFPVRLHQQQQSAAAREEYDRDRACGFQDDRDLPGRIESALLSGAIIRLVRLTAPSGVLEEMSCQRMGRPACAASF